MPRARLGITAHHISHDPGGNDLAFNHVLARAIADVDVTNTAVETDLFRFTIPANKILAAGNLRLTMSGDALMNSVANLRLRVYLGASILFDTTTAFTWTNSALRRNWKLVTEIEAAGATNAQRCYTSYHLCQALATGVPHFFTGADELHSANFATAAEDTTLARDIAVTALWSTAAATLSKRARQVWLELEN